MKLIRDKIAAHLLQEGGHTVFPVSKDYEFVIFLNKKLDEAVLAFKSATSKERALGEAADVLEVLTSILGLNGHTLKDLLRTQHEQRQLQGGFDNRYVLDNDPVT